MEKKLYNIIKDLFKIPEDQVAKATMKTIRDWNSLSHIELMMTLEEEFALPKISPDEIVFMTSVENIKIILENHGILF